MSTHPNAPRLRGSSPWGGIDLLTPLGPDAVNVSTPSHGGIWVSPDALARIPEAFRTTAYSPGPWFEEDCDWAIPYAFLGLHEHETDPERRARYEQAARETLEAFHPQAFAALKSENQAPAHG